MAGRAMKAAAWAVWPVGVVLTVAYAEAGVLPLPAFLFLDFCYAAAVLMVIRSAGPRAALLISPAAVVFAFAALTGAPTASDPAAMLCNAGILAVAAVLVLGGLVGFATRLWDGPGRDPAALAVVALTVGSAGYLLNLLARVAVVLSGAAPAQAMIEDTAWQAHAYLRGLDGQPSSLALQLVWMDLMQYAYVVLAYSAAALTAMAMGRGGLIGSTAARTIAGAGLGMATATVGAGVLGATAGDVGAVAAGAAFALTIPFMSTLLPALLGAAAASHPHRPPRIPASNSATASIVSP